MTSLSSPCREAILPDCEDCVTQKELRTQFLRLTRQMIPMSDPIPPTSAARRLTAYSFLAVFANDGTIDEGELEMLEKIAFEDGILDSEEKRVLGYLFGRVSEDTVSETVWKEIQRLRSEYDLVQPD